MTTLEMTHVSKLMSNSLINPPTLLLEQFGSVNSGALTRELAKIARVLAALNLLENRRFVLLRCTLQPHHPMGLAADEAQLHASNDAVVK